MDTVKNTNAYDSVAIGICAICCLGAGLYLMHEIMNNDYNLSIHCGNFKMDFSKSIA